MNNNKYCEQCGQPINKESKFCASCGEKIISINSEKIILDNNSNKNNKTTSKNQSKNYFCNKCNLKSNDSDECKSCGDSNKESVLIKTEQQTEQKDDAKTEKMSVGLKLLIAIILISVGNFLYKGADGWIIQLIGALIAGYGYIEILRLIYNFFKD